MIRSRLLRTALLSAVLALTGFAAQAEIIGAPSPVPHPVTDYLPITKDVNSCIACHKPQRAPERKKGEIPFSHYDKKGALDGSRWECMLCHGQMNGFGELPAVDPNDDVR